MNTITINPPPGVKPPRRRLGRAEKVLLILALFLLLCCGAAVAFVALAANRSPQTIGGPFTLQASDGRTVSDRTFRGKYMLIYFGYTFCPDVCPTTMADLTVALKTLGAKAEEIQPLFITVDPKRDTADVLKAYTAPFSPSLLGLTGSPFEIAAVEKEYRVVANVERTGKEPDDYVVDHASLFYLMGPDGNFITVIPADGDGEALAKEIASHLSH